MIRKVFAIASLLLFLAIVAIAIDDYNQEWRTWQRAYYTALKAHDQGGSLSIFDRVGIELLLDVNKNKVVTNPDRIADTCMTCHINNKLDWGQDMPLFKQNPLKGLFDIHKDVFIVTQLPFDQVGCTACHGGDPLALTSEKAHEFLRDNFADIFEASLKDLRSDKQMVRQRAIETIRWMTGNFFGYKFSDPLPDREKAIHEAEQWWEIHKETFAEAGYGEQGSSFQTPNLLASQVQDNPSVSATGEELKFVGSNTCIGCHTNPHPGGSSYIPDTNKVHVEKWFQDAFKTSVHPEIYISNHPTLFENLLSQAIPDPTRREEIRKFLEDARTKGVLPKPNEIQELVNYMKGFDITCEACHGPGSQFVQMMMKGLALDYQGNSTDAADMIKKARSIALNNAKTSIQDSKIWGIFQTLIANAAQSAEVKLKTNLQPITPRPAEPQTPSKEAESSTQPPATQPSRSGAALIDKGKELAMNNGCLSCHSMDGSKIVGPTWLGLYGKTETLADGTQVAVDEKYLHESVRDPGAKVVQNYPNIMPPFDLAKISEGDLQAIIAFIKSLKPAN